MIDATTPARTVSDALERFAELHPGKLGRQALARIEDIAALAVTLKCEDDGGGIVTIHQGLGVTGAFLMDEAGLAIADLVEIFGRPVTWCEYSQRWGRRWIESYAAELARKGKPFDVTPREPGRKLVQARRLEAMLARVAGKG